MKPIAKKGVKKGAKTFETLSKLEKRYGIK